MFLRVVFVLLSLMAIMLTFLDWLLLILLVLFSNWDSFAKEVSFLVVVRLFFISNTIWFRCYCVKGGRWFNFSSQGVDWVDLSLLHIFRGCYSFLLFQITLHIIILLFLKLIFIFSIKITQVIWFFTKSRKCGLC